LIEKHDSPILYDEVLEFLFMKREDGEEVSHDDLMSYNHFGHEFSTELLDEMVSRGLVRKSDTHVIFTAAGLDRATKVIRWHRLAERLLVDVLNVQDELIESSACRFEHILSGEVADSICTLLGHPKTCPHGREIPPGECCLSAEKEVLPILKPLSQASPGDSGVVAYISSRFHERLSRLASLGVSPGQELRVRQIKPTFIISFGETELALEKKVADGIYIRVPNNHARKEVS
jgi:DtxR family Mn-dependent transcriptional regulator